MRSVAPGMTSRGRRWLGGGALLLAAILAGCGPTDGDEGTTADTSRVVDLESARALAERGRYDSALRLYTVLVERGGRVAVALNERGMVRSARGEHEEAVADLDSALALRPGWPPALSNLAVANLALSRWDRALSVLDTLASLRPDDPKVHYELAHAWKGKGRTVRAIEELDRALELDPELVEARMTRGSLYAGRDDLDLAIADFERAASISGSAKARRNLAIARLEAGQLEPAERLFTELIGRDPLRARYYLYRGRARRGLGRDGEAASDFRRVLELTGNPAVRQRAIDALRGMEGAPEGAETGS